MLGGIKQARHMFGHSFIFFSTLWTQIGQNHIGNQLRQTEGMANRAQDENSMEGQEDPQT